MANRNPQTTVGDSVRKSKEALQLGYGVVDSVNAHASGDDNKHIVSVQPAGKNTTFPAQVPVFAQGDVNPPIENDIPVLYAKRSGDIAVILSLLYSRQDEVPEYEPGERRIGHALTDANISINEDGQVTVESSGGATVVLQDDGTVTINGGTQGAIYDINTTSADGYLTSIDIQRRSDILI